MVDDHLEDFQMERFPHHGDEKYLCRILVSLIIQRIHSARAFASVSWRLEALL